MNDDIYLDIETNGYLENTTEVHVIGTRCKGIDKVFSSNLGNIEEGLRYLMESSSNIVAHNGIKFDVPALQKVYPWFQIDDHRMRDTLVMSRLMYTNLFDTDPKLIMAKKLKPNMIGRHSIEAWGQRLGIHKIGYQGGFEAWSQEMEDYCVGDVAVLEAIHKHFMKKKYPAQALKLEHDVAIILARQERRGFSFNVAGAVELYAEISKERMVLERNLRESFPPFYLKDGKKPFTPKVDSKKYGYVAGAELTKVKLTEFNPASRSHIAKRLMTLRGWKPEQFTNDGSPKVDDAVLIRLPYPEAKLLARYMMLNKRVGQIAEGQQAWLKLEREGVIYGGVITNGAVTGRMTHANPNLAQVPATKSPYGAECRNLFQARKGYVLVGADASALELRCLAGYMAAFDKGAYIQTVINGKNVDGTDIHSVNMKALGITLRDMAKTWIYAFLYGAGDEKLGTTLGASKGKSAVTMGKASRAKFLDAIPAMGELTKRVKAKVEPKTTKWVKGRKVSKDNPKFKGHLKGLDGRLLHCRSSHSALNTLLQSAGAIIMKQALVCLDGLLKETLVTGVDYEFVANVHDEWQIEAKPEHAEHVGKMCVKAMEMAGEQLNFACPITGEYSIGNTWKDTH